MDPDTAEAQAGRIAAQLAAVFDNAPLGMGLFDADLRHVRVNDALAELNGVPVRDLIGRTPAEVNGAVGAEAELLYRQVMQSGQPARDVPIAGSTSAAPGDPRHWRLSVFPVRSTGGPGSGPAGADGLCVIVVEDTERQRLAARLADSEQRHRHLAETLQRSLQPPLLPRLAGAEVASVYRPAAGGSLVGGDFYDVFRLGESSWAMVIGDVQGKGAEAAALTAAARYAVRTAASRSDEPGQVLATVNDVLVGEHQDEGFCTLAYLHATRSRQQLRVVAASAGHPPPTVVRSTGEIEVLGEPAALLGVLREHEVVEASARLQPGDSIVLYTDGVTEARYRGPDGRLELFGEHRLHAVLSDCAGSDAATTAARIDRAVLDFQAGRAADDTAVLVLRVTDDPS